MEGAPAILLGVFCLFVLSDKPASAPWLADDQKAWLDGRLQSEGAREKRVENRRECSGISTFSS